MTARLEDLKPDAQVRGLVGAGTLGKGNPNDMGDNEHSLGWLEDL